MPLSASNQMTGEEQYLLDELTRTIRHEYLGGTAYAMSGGSAHHNLIAGNLYVALRQHYKPQGCRVFQENMKVRITWDSHPYYYYPDVMLCCDPKDKGDEYFCERPCVLVEVLSDSTSRTDRVEKLRAYQQLPSLHHYLIVSQQAMFVTLHSRGNDWQPAIFTAVEDLITLDCGAAHSPISISLATIYESVLDN